MCSRGRRCPSDSVSAAGDYRDFSVKCFHDRCPFLLFPVSGRIAQQHVGSPCFGHVFFRLPRRFSDTVSPGGKNLLTIKKYIGTDAM